LQREFPLHVVCSWLGNSPRIAQQSYLLVTEEDCARAAGLAKVPGNGHPYPISAILYVGSGTSTAVAIHCNPIIATIAAIKLRIG
jgi:hypothetical protein